MRAAAVVLSLLLSAPAFAQYTERVDVWVGNVDVVVTDRAGNPVRGLTRDDFEIFEDGRKQPITNFSAFEETASAQRAQTDATSALETQQPRPRLIVLFVDIVDVEPAVRQRFFRAMRSFLDTGLRDGDLLTVLTWNHRVRVALAPTSSRAMMNKVLDIFSSPFGVREGAMVAELQEMKMQQAAIDAAVAQELGISMAADSDAEAAFAQWQAAEELCAEMKRKPRELRNLLASISRIDMQKVLLFASDNAVTSSLSRRLPAACIPKPEWEALADTANAYGITIHAFHPPGIRDPMAVRRPTPSLRGPAPGGGESMRTFEESGGLIDLAARTGGITGVGPAQAATKLVEVARQLDVYYSIGYRMEPGNDDKTRELRVVTKDRSHRVRARKSIVRPSEATRVRDEVVTGLYLAPSDASQTPKFTARIVKVTPDGRYRLAHIEVRLSSTDLVLLDRGDGRKKGAFSVYVAAGREIGDASDVSEMKQEFDVPPGVADLPLVYTFASRIRPDTRRLSIALRDNTTGEVSRTVLQLRTE